MSQAATGGAHGGHEDSEHLQHHFESMEQQFDSGKLGIWLFLSTEILLFGGLFCAYAIYRANHPEIFIYAHRYLDKILGGINTLVLLCSSLTMAWAVRCAQLGKQRALKVLLSLTLLGGFGFMGIKGIEYEHKWKHGLLWGKRFAPESHANGGHGEGAAASQATSAAVAGAKAPPLPAPIQTERGVLIERSQIPPAAEAPKGTVPMEPVESEHGGDGSRPSNVQVFFGIYFMMTGLHGVHVLAGMIAIGWILSKATQGTFGPQYYAPVDFVGLYWHLVDLIWIFLFPLLYLIH